jgi:hypothetical protein
VPAEQRRRWHQEQLSVGYVQPDYLEREWMSTR